MRTSRLCAVAAAFVIALTACSASSIADAPSANSLQNFREGSWTFVVDRAFRVGDVPVTSPSVPLPESGYTPISIAKSYLLNVSENGARVDVANPKLVGTLIHSSTSELVYSVEQGTFAGGRIVVWKGSNDGLQAELTIFGSGVPIAASERGAVRGIVPL